MNVLEHTQDISSHLETCVKYLKDKNSVIFMQCPNYSFPFEPHFYEFFVPFFPKFTFKHLRKKSLIKQLGKEKYNNILNNLNFDCTYFKLKRLNLPITFTHPLKDIFDRLDSDLEFKKRLFSNNLIKISYNLIKFLKIKYNKKKINLYFMNEKYIDSLKIFELISIIEKKFNVKISQSDLQKDTVGTIKGMADLINDKINRKKLSK